MVDIWAIWVHVGPIGSHRGHLGPMGLAKWSRSVTWAPQMSSGSPWGCRGLWMQDLWMQLGADLHRASQRGLWMQDLWMHLGADQQPTQALRAAIFELKLECLEGSDRSILMLSSCSSTIEGIKSPCSALHMRGSRPVGFRVESVFGASKNRKIENAQNRILNVRF